MEERYDISNNKNFKVGDKVVCIDNDDLNFSLRKNVIYTISHVFGTRMVYVNDIDCGFFSSRFRKTNVQLELF